MKLKGPATHWPNSIYPFVFILLVVAASNSELSTLRALNSKIQCKDKDGHITGRRTMLKRPQVSWDPAISLRHDHSGTELVKSGMNQ